jgi:hypothetical protein
VSRAAQGTFPAIDTLVTKAAAAQSVADALIAMANSGQLGQLEADIRRMRQAAEAGHQLAKGPTPAQRAAAAKAAGFRAKASAATLPADRADYLELAKAAEAEAGVR